MTHIKYPNNLVPPDFNNLGQRIVYEPSWQVEAMQQNALLHDALTRAETAEAKLAKAVEALREIKSVECEYCTDYFHQLANEVLAELEKAE